MQLAGTYIFAAPAEVVWETLMDPRSLAQAMPGGEDLVQVGENEYQAVMQVRVGPVQGRFEGRIELSDIVAPESYRMKVSGQGAPGFVSGEGALRLESQENGATLLTYAGDVQVGGRIAGVSQRLVESSAKSLTRQGLQALDREIQARLYPELAAESQEAEAPVSAEAAPTEAQAVAGTLAEAEVQAEADGAPVPVSEARTWKPVPTKQHRHVVQQPSASSVMATTMKDVASDLASDYLTPSQQERALWAALGALGMLLFVVLVRLVQRD